MFEGNPSQAAQQILDGTYDFYAGGLTMAQMEALESSSISYDWDVKRQYELLINPVSTESTTDMINPFSSAEIRKALNLLLDRSYIADEIFAGGAVPKYQPLIYKSADYNLNEAAIEAITRTYQYDYDAAKAAIDTAMTAMGAEPDDAGNWTYKGEPVDIKILIRTDDELRVDIGEYLSSHLKA
jgi:peptide/nickel transport system substrate-binding protein